MEKELQAILLTMAMNLEASGYDKTAMSKLFENWMGNPSWKRELLIRFLKTTDTGRRLYLELMTMMSCVPKEAITFTIG